MANSLFQLPDELILAPVLQTYPCRERQIRSLATLLHPDAAPCRNLTLHGIEATGKTAVTSSLLHSLAANVPTLRYTVVNAAQCITARHLFETVVASVAEAVDWPQDDVAKRCETLAALDVELCRMLMYTDRGDGFRFVLVLDAIDRAREAPPTLMPGLARLSEIIPSLTTVFIVTAPPAHHLRSPSSPTLHFPPYTKPDFIRILTLSPPCQPIRNATLPETTALWTRFCAAVHDALVRPAARSLPAFRHACEALWPRFVAPLERGVYEPKEFSKLLVAARSHFQDEGVLNPGIVSVRPAAAAGQGQDGGPTPKSSTAELSALLPRLARMLLLCAYLASHNAPRHDLTLFSTHHQASRRRRRGGGGGGAGGVGPRRQHRKIARKLLGAHAFVLERMLAIFAAVRTEWIDDGGREVGGQGALDADVGMALATLASLRLLNRVGVGGDVMDRGGKWRINVGWEVVRGVGRSIGVEIEDWLIE
ncbi:Origin recognition complex subunit-like protein [Hapsidospora chrysogenum ATCC 11550]|uniref:Origin recognition complex subunit-like protein n=1 Tax=Hapsidospora chrysogenum (strain ATCC 11550 / CBS 779.69 / DSM 880 / IAM 14645 / JCM 23072 / IMI 49137) TaxID=857340 RepID=A0A086SYR4_HAPC1|nr:Origin recognition complex subunit-like protein [Hapsidospora chrysogenum ATCC 11550]